MDHNSNEIKGQKCELCGMEATASAKDEHGVVHYYCEHHAPKKEEHVNHEKQGAYNKHAGHSTEMFRKKFWLSLLLTIPVLAFSEFPKILGLNVPTFSGSNYIPIAFSTIVFFYGGLVFLKGSFSELKNRVPGMMTLIALAISVAYGYSLAAFFLKVGADLFWELTTLITIMLLGHWMEMRSVSQAQGALRELAKLLPDTAERIKGDETETVALAELRVGDKLLVRPGAKIPADGEVYEGETDVNESMITGESRPVSKSIGFSVIAGTVNGSGSLKIKVTKIGEDTALSGIMRLVAEAQASKSKTQILADRAAFYLTIVAITFSSITFAAWVFSGAGVAFGLERMVTVLVIACPHALGLAIPLVTSISTTLSARNGLLIKERMALEAARNIDVVLFDKTGTLTKGEQGVTDFWAVSGNEKEILGLAAAVESESEHMIAKGIVSYARSKNINIPKVNNFRSVAGKGVEGGVGGKKIRVGGPQLLKELETEIPKEIGKSISKAEKEGKTIIYTIEGEKIIGAFALSDVIREESREAVAALKKMGKRVAMLTGDSEDVASYVAKEMGLSEYFSQVLPEFKAEKVKELQKDGSRVAMVGDGVNDAPALTQADIGIAIGAGTDVAIESAGIILVKNDPRDVVKVIELSGATYGKMIQNLFWASGYNIIAIPLAAGILAGKGVILAPALGAVFMSLSTIIVALNAQLLRRLKL